MTVTPGFAVSWEAGASAQIEVFSPELTGGADSYRIKCTPTFRKTIRPPLDKLRLGSGELNPIRDRLNELVGVVNARGRNTPPPVPVEEVIDLVKLAGSQLLDLVVPQDFQAELRLPDLFLEIGVDEALVEYPWELMYDGSEFVCLRHLVGRFVNASKSSAPAQELPSRLSPGKLSVLLISVPRPMPRKNGDRIVEYAALPEAEAETKAIQDILVPLARDVELSLLTGKDATFDGVFKAIKARPYHIVHFNGHGYLDNDNPNKSALVLFDRDFSTGQIFNFFCKRPPLFFFMNACDTARTSSTSTLFKDSYDIFDLARSFLETGAYLIGNRSKVGDKGADAFAKAFYLAMIAGQPLGRAVRDARIACRNAAAADDFSWASYILYGDPRLFFKKL